jgi:hypothetical protein
MGKSLSFVDYCHWCRPIAWIVGRRPSSRALPIEVALVHMCNLYIHRLICFLCDR